LCADALQRAGVQTGIQAWPGEVREQTLVVCVINPFTMFVIPAPIFIGMNSSRIPEKHILDAASSAAWHANQK